MPASICVNCASEMDAYFCMWFEEGGCKENVLEDNESSMGFVLGLSDTIQEEKVLKDPVSAGRKRAAVMYPILPGQVCAWAWRKVCGGGIEPITGCTGRPATNIHHGPDKSTLNNGTENISVICTFCHNRWHVANDKYYPDIRPVDNSEWLPNKFPDMPIRLLNEIQKATKQEILINEMTIPEGGKDGK